MLSFLPSLSPINFCKAFPVVIFMEEGISVLFRSLIIVSSIDSTISLFSPKEYLSRSGKRLCLLQISIISIVLSITSLINISSEFKLLTIGSDSSIAFLIFDL